MSRRCGAICVIFAITAISSAAMAQSVCVDCTDPDKNYRCIVKDAERIQAGRSLGRGLEFLCISEIARANGHKSCRVNTTFSGPCIGQPHEIDLAKAGSDGVIVGRPGDPPADGAAIPREAPAALPAKKGPPQTVEELAKETVAKSKEQFGAVDEKMRQAGGAVGNAVKKSWDCLSSLFSKC